MYQFEEFLRAPDKVENGSQKAPTLQWWQNLRQHFRNARATAVYPFSVDRLEPRERVEFLTRFLHCVRSYKILCRQALDYLEMLLDVQSWRNSLLSVSDPQLWLLVAASRKDTRCHRASRELLNLLVADEDGSGSSAVMVVQDAADCGESGFSPGRDDDEDADVQLNQHASGGGFLSRAKRKLLAPTSKASSSKPGGAPRKGSNTLQIPGLAQRGGLEPPGSGNQALLTPRSSCVGSPVSCLGDDGEEESIAELRSGLRSYLGLATEEQGLANTSEDLEREISRRCDSFFAQSGRKEELRTAYLHYWHVWLSEHSKLAKSRSPNFLLQEMLAFDRAWEDLPSDVLNGSVKFDPFEDCPLVKPIGVVGSNDGKCGQCGKECFREKAGERVKIKGRGGLYTHKPRYCVVCSTWFCGYCKRKKLKTIAANESTKFASYVCSGASEKSETSTDDCAALFKRNKSRYVAMPWDAGSGGVLKDPAFFALLKQNASTPL